MKFVKAFNTESGEDITSFQYKFAYYEYNKTAKLVCPECKMAEIIFNNAKKPYFSTMKYRKHSENCSLKQPELPIKSVKSFYESRINLETVKRHLKSLAYKVQNTKSKKSHNNENNNETTREIKLVKNEAVAICPAIKSLGTKFYEKDYDVPKYFYGSVTAKWRKTKNGKDETIFKLLIHHNKTGNFLINVTKKVYAYIPAGYKNESFSCDIYLFTDFSLKNNRCQSALIHSDYLLMENIQSNNVQ